MKRIVAAAALLFAVSCDASQREEEAVAPLQAMQPAKISLVGIDDLAEKFVKLALALGEHDKSYVDAYDGPAEWAEAARSEQRSLGDLKSEAQAILEALSVLKRDGAAPRELALERQTIAALTRIRMASGEKIPFDEEARLLYGLAPPQYALAEFDEALRDMDALLPGEGDLAGRVEEFRNSLAIPNDKLQIVFDAAIAECRRRTKAHYELPETERFTMRFVTDKPWSGYNWYQGEFESVIEINTDLPIVIDRAVDLGCHEGYPGHHVSNVVVERDLRIKNGWVEYSIYPLFSPQSLLSEGSANFGISLAFPGDEKIAFETGTLFPLAGLDPSKAATLNALNAAQRKLSHARNHIAREYLDGRIDREAATALSMKYGLISRERAEQGVDFIDSYRSYVVNYNVGRDLVETYVEAEAAKGADRWTVFEALLKNPDAIGQLLPD